MQEVVRLGCEIGLQDCEKINSYLNLVKMKEKREKFCIFDFDNL
jgi:hypothetical protein